MGTVRRQLAGGILGQPQGSALDRSAEADVGVRLRCHERTSTKEIAHPARQRGVIGRRGASLDELEALYRSRFDVFARVAASVTGDSERARDAVQEAFATAVRKRRSFRGDGPLEAWVWRIVLNAARSDVRRSVPAVEYDEPAAANGHPERDAELRVALARLPERQRTAVFLRYYADLDYAAIGEALGITPEPSPQPSMPRTRRFAADWRRYEHDRSRPRQPRPHPSPDARLG